MISIKETARYLGYGKNLPDEGVCELIKICIDEVEAAAEPKNVCRRFDVYISENNIIETAGLKIQSRNLAVNLKDCTEAVLMAATLGIGIDRLLARYQKLDIAKAAVIQAAAAAMIEEYCDEIQENIRCGVIKEGFYVRPRFSPGYGDWSLNDQPLFLKVLEAGKLAGITLSDGGIMLPEKSVTAIMGLARIDAGCNKEGCESCSLTGCQYRR